MSDKPNREKVRVLVVDDSQVARDLLVHLLEADPDIQIVATASNGEEAVDAVARTKPDVVTMDFHMPKMNGLEATRTIMQTNPVPIVIVSESTVREDVSAAFQLLEAGALAVAEKPFAINHPRYEAVAIRLVQTVKLMAAVKVVRRWPKHATAIRALSAVPVANVRIERGNVQIVVIGASTGGPVVLDSILSALPKEFPVPILIVQHIAPGFTQGFVDWLSRSTGFPIHMAHNGERPLPGHVYVAPDSVHMKLAQDGRISLFDDASVNGHRPSVSTLFDSVAAVSGCNAIGVLLSGMGTDGAEGLRSMRDSGAITIAQDAQSSIVHGMPGKAIALNAATHVLNPMEIASALAGLVANARQSAMDRTS